MKRTLTVAVAALGMCAPALAQKTIDAKPAEAQDMKLPEFEKPAVWFGTKAPELKIAEFIKGEPVTSFENGRVYVVEFWATWCGPCIKAFPHLSELQKEYGDKVTIVGVNIWDTQEQNDETQAERVERVKKFVDEQGDRMSYTVAVESGDAMASGWMKAAERNGIPCAFIVDGAGKIAWIGHPGGIDEPLGQVIAGDYDMKAAAKKAADAVVSQQQTTFVMDQIRTGDAEKGYAMATKMVKGAWKDNAGLLNQVAWVTLTEDAFPVHNAEFSILAASRACELTNWEDPMILDTLARSYYENGEPAKALEIQTKAVDLIGDENPEVAAEFKNWLITYQEAADLD